jgi:hypothetical protein
VALRSGQTSHHGDPRYHSALALSPTLPMARRHQHGCHGPTREITRACRSAASSFARAPRAMLTSRDAPRCRRCGVVADEGQGRLCRKSKIKTPVPNNSSGASSVASGQRQWQRPAFSATAAQGSASRPPFGCPGETEVSQNGTLERQRVQGVAQGSAARPPHSAPAKLRSASEVGRRAILAADLDARVTLTTQNVTTKRFNE